MKCDRRVGALKYERHLSAAGTAELRAFYEKFPGWKRRWDLIAEYARSEGGLVLQFWELYQGPAFGKPVRCSLGRCAERLGVSVSELVDIGQRTMETVEPILRTDPEWRRLQRLSRGEREAILHGHRPA